MASTVSHPMANAEKLKKAKTTSGAAATAADEQHIGDYQIRPTENFDAVKIKEIIIDVFQQVLDGIRSRHLSKLLFRYSILCVRFRQGV